MTEKERPVYGCNDPWRTDEAVRVDDAGGVRSEPDGRAERLAGGEPLELAEAFCDRLAGARTEEEIVGPGGVLSHSTKRLDAG